MVDVLLSEQAAYYRRRAREYDATAYPDLSAAAARIGALVRTVSVTGHVLEIGCGTGMWTGALRASARTVTAIDSAPEMIELARNRVPDDAVEFVVTDVFDWAPPRRFDTIFFAFWLSHVPACSFAQFWTLLRDWAGEEARVVFVDEKAGEATKETYEPGSPEIVRRRLADGSVHRLVKVFWEPADLQQRLDSLGWNAEMRPAGPDWLVGEARPR